MRRLDHAMIFLLIAGTYTPVGLLALHGTLGTVVLAVVWGGALAGIVLQLAWTGAPRWLGGVVYLALGWVAVVAMPQLFARLGVAGGLLLVAGGLVYSAGGGGVCPAPPRPAARRLRLPRGVPPAGDRRGRRPLPGHQPVRATHWLTHPTGGPCGRGGLPRVLCQRGAVQLRRR
jgi:hypothetical protein